MSLSWQGLKKDVTQWGFLVTPPGMGIWLLYSVQMDAAFLGDRLPEVTQKPFHSPGSLPSQPNFGLRGRDEAFFS